MMYMTVLSPKNFFWTPVCIARCGRMHGLLNAAVRQRRRDEVMGIIETRNSINHVILNRLMMLRYQLRKRPVLLQCIMYVEALFVRSGVIYYGRIQYKSHGNG